MLEPQGVVEIKFRTPELIATMHRIDPVILKLKVGNWCKEVVGLSAAMHCTSQGHHRSTRCSPSCRPRAAPAATRPSRRASASSCRCTTRWRCSLRRCGSAAAACLVEGGAMVAACARVWRAWSVGWVHAA